MRHYSRLAGCQIGSEYRKTNSGGTGDRSGRTRKTDRKGSRAAGIFLASAMAAWASLLVGGTAQAEGIVVPAGSVLNSGDVIGPWDPPLSDPYIWKQNQTLPDASVLFDGASDNRINITEQSHLSVIVLDNVSLNGKGNPAEGMSNGISLTANNLTVSDSFATILVNADKAVSGNYIELNNPEFYSLHMNSGMSCLIASPGTITGNQIKLSEGILGTNFFRGNFTKYVVLLGDVSHVRQPGNDHTEPTAAAKTITGNTITSEGTQFNAAYWGTVNVAMASQEANGNEFTLDFKNPGKIHGETDTYIENRKLSDIEASGFRFISGEKKNVILDYKTKNTRKWGYHEVGQGQGKYIKYTDDDGKIKYRHVGTGNGNYNYGWYYITQQIPIEDYKFVAVHSATGNHLKLKDGVISYHPGYLSVGGGGYLGAFGVRADIQSDNHLRLENVTLEGFYLKSKNKDETYDYTRDGTVGLSGQTISDSEIYVGNSEIRSNPLDTKAYRWPSSIVGIQGAVVMDKEPGGNAANSYTATGNQILVENSKLYSGGGVYGISGDYDPNGTRDVMHAFLDSAANNVITVKSSSIKNDHLMLEGILATKATGNQISLESTTLEPINHSKDLSNVGALGIHAKELADGNTVAVDGDPSGSGKNTGWTLLNQGMAGIAGDVLADTDSTYTKTDGGSLT